MLIGNLGKDAETRKVGEKSVIKFTVATTENFKKADGTAVVETEWHDCEWWVSSDKIAPYLLKGTQVYVEGSIKTDSFTGQDGQKRYTKKVKVSQLQLLGGKRESQSSGNVTPSAATEPLDDMPW